MSKGAKIAMFVVIGLLVAAGVGYFVVKSAVEKIINDPETRAEIAKVVESGLANIIVRPKVSIQSLKLSGLSQVDIGPSSLSASGRTILNATGYARCAVLRLLISGSCKGELFLDFGGDGSLQLQSMILRALLEGGTPPNIRVNGSLSNFNTMSLVGDRSGSKAPIQVAGGRITGTLEATVKTGRDITVNGRLSGDLKGVSLGANIAGHSRDAKLDIPLSVGFDNKKLFFITPLKANLFGNDIEYTGEMKFDREPLWSGSVSSKSGKSAMQSYIPTIFRCRSRPANVTNFRITGPISNPECR